MKICKTSWILLMVICMVSFFNPSIAWSAGCPAVENVTAPSTLNIDPSLAVGSIVGSTTVTFASGAAECPAGTFHAGTNYYSINGIGVPNGNLYPTSIPGIAYKARVTAGWPGTELTYTWPSSLTDTVVPIPRTYSGGYIKVDFVKTGPLGSGTFGPQTIGRLTINNVPILEFYLNSPIVLAPVTPACTITQSAIAVNLDDTNTSQLTSMGNTSKDKAFSIPLNCTSASNISLSFSGDIADTNNAVFSNLSGSTNANSVGVQILKDNTPVPTAAGTYLNLGTINGSVSVPMTARYYALTNNADAGAVSAIAYATIMYN